MPATESRAVRIVLERRMQGERRQCPRRSAARTLTVVLRYYLHRRGLTEHAVHGGLRVRTREPPGRSRLRRRPADRGGTDRPWAASSRPVCRACASRSVASAMRTCVPVHVGHRACAMSAAAPPSLVSRMR